VTYKFAQDLTEAFIANFSQRHEFDREAIERAILAALDTPAGVRARNLMTDAADLQAEIAEVVSAVNRNDIRATNLRGIQVLDKFTTIHRTGRPEVLAAGRAS
jgi:hypothetical protein